VVNASGPYRGLPSVTATMTAAPRDFEFTLPSLEDEISKEIPFEGNVTFARGRHAANMKSRFNFGFRMGFNDTLGKGARLSMYTKGDRSAKINVAGAGKHWGLPVALSAKDTDQEVEVFVPAPSASDIKQAEDSYRKDLKGGPGSKRAKMEKEIKEAEAAGDCGWLSACSSNKKIIEGWDKNNERKVKDCSRLLNSVEKTVRRLKDCLPIERFELVLQSLCKGYSAYCEEVQTVAESVMPKTGEVYGGDSLRPIYEKLLADVKCWDAFYSYDQFKDVWGKEGWGILP